MVNAENVQNRGVQVAYMNRILSNMIAKLIGCPVGQPDLVPPPAIHMVKACG